LGQPKIKRQIFEDLGVNEKKNNNIPLKGIGWERVDWIDLAQDREK
jgi:hypothetical protein